MEPYKLSTNQFALIRSNRNITNLAYCVLELVLNSLNAQAMSIAIRIQFERHKIQVIDNGIGINKDLLRHIGEYYTGNKYVRQMYTNYFGASGETLANIRRLSSCLIITTRNHCSSDTYVKIFRSGHTSKLVGGEHRPAQGTTVTVFGLRDVPSLHRADWDRDHNISAVHFIIASLAMVNTKVSFSIRDDMEGNIVMGIGKIHNPLKVLDLMCGQSVLFNYIRYIQVDTTFGLKCSGYVGICCSQLNTVQYVFVNQRPVYCPELQKLISENVIEALLKHAEVLTLNTASCREERVLYLLYIKCLYSEYSISVKNGIILVVFHKSSELLNCIKTSINNAFAKNVNSSPEKVLYNDCKSKDYEIAYPNCLGGEQIKRNKDVKACNSATVSYYKTPLPRTKQQHIIRQNLQIKTNCLTKTVLPNKAINALSWKRYFNFPFVQCNYHFLRNGIKKSVFKCNNKNLSEEYKESIHNLKMFKFNIQWRKLILTYVTNHNYQSKKNKNLNIRERWSKYLNAIRKNFAKCMISQKKRLIERTVKQSVSMKKKCLKMKENSFDEKFHSYDHSIMKTDSSYVTLKKDCDDVRKSHTNDMNSTVANSLNTFKKSSEINKPDKVVEEIDFHLNDSDWSDWTYHNRQEWPASFKRYDFLPLQLNTLLPYGHKKLTSRTLLGTTFQTSNLKNSTGWDVNTICRRQDLEVRQCKTKAHFYELVLPRTCLNSIKIMRQINREFIAALITQDNKELLVLIDQHAVDERIRYENLLEDYRVDGTNDFVSVDLTTPIQIHGLPKGLNQLLLANSTLLKQFGLSLKSGINDSLLLTSIPKCLSKRKFYEDDTKVALAVRKLVLELGENLMNTNVTSVIPTAIHHAIATEACHGAIKFGDPLTPEQCKRLMELLKNSKAPYRCAHGRPSFIPLLELTELRKRQTKIAKGKLNFTSLKRVSTLHKEDIGNREF